MFTVMRLISAGFSHYPEVQFSYEIFHKLKWRKAQSILCFSKVRITATLLSWKTYISMVAVLLGV